MEGETIAALSNMNAVSPILPRYDDLCNNEVEVPASRNYWSRMSPVQLSVPTLMIEGGMNIKP